MLSAIEGLNVALPSLEQHLIVFMAMGIIVVLFMVQKFGTGRVGIAFGPIMALWFLTIGVLGTVEVFKEPEILLALNPWHGVKFFLANGRIAFLALGAIVLAVTGAEALYADMGHFGKRPIRVAWFSLVLPALVLNYMGQGAPG